LCLYTKEITKGRPSSNCWGSQSIVTEETLAKPATEKNKESSIHNEHKRNKEA
jgi:hypothetical protein